MKNFRKFSALFMLCAALLCGCTQSNIVSPTAGMVEGAAVPDLETKNDIQIDWAQMREDLREVYIEPYGTYGDYVMDLDVTYDSDSDTMILLLPVNSKTTPEIAVAYAQDVLKTSGDLLSEQDFSNEPSKEEGTYYGSYFDKHNVRVQVFPYTSQDDESTYLVNDTIKAGEQREVKAQTK